MQENGRKPEILIVYLSRTNNTKVVAEMIQESIGRRPVALELDNPYPENYKAIVDQHRQTSAEIQRWLRRPNLPVETR